MHLRFYDSLWFVACLVIAAAPLSACAKQPYAATTNLKLTPEEQGQKQVLTPAEEKQAMAILKSVADGVTPVDPPTTARHGVRWRDVPAAASAACSETEMVIVRSTQHAWGTEFTLLTIEDFPGTLNVRKAGDGRVYEADATIGLFGNHTKRAQQLLAAFSKSMIAYGKRLDFEHDPFEKPEAGE